MTDQPQTSPAPPPTVIIVDDHPMVRDGLAVMLEARRAARVVAKAGGLDDAVRAVQRLGVPDVVVSDVRMPGGDGFAVLERLRRFWPGIRVLFLAGMPVREEEERARAAGARGYLPKSCDLDVLGAALRAIATARGVFASETVTPAPNLLSKRETDVLGYMAEGKTRDEIAIILGIGCETVKSRQKSLMKKLDVTNAAAAVHRAHELGILR